MTYKYLNMISLTDSHLDTILMYVISEWMRTKPSTLLWLIIHIQLFGLKIHLTPIFKRKTFKSHRARINHFLISFHEDILEEDISQSEVLDHSSNTMCGICHFALDQQFNSTNLRVCHFYQLYTFWLHIIE